MFKGVLSKRRRIMGILSARLVRLPGRTRRDYFHDYKSSLDSGQHWHLSTKPSEGCLSFPTDSNHHIQKWMWQEAMPPHAFPWCYDLYKIWRSHSSHISIFTGIVLRTHWRLSPFRFFCATSMAAAVIESHRSPWFLTMTQWKGLKTGGPLDSP